MKISEEKRKNIILSTLIALGIIPVGIPALEAGKLLLNINEDKSHQEIDDELLTLTIKTILGIPISFTTAGIMSEYLDKEEEKELK